MKIMRNWEIMEIRRFIEDIVTKFIYYCERNRIWLRSGLWNRYFTLPTFYPFIDLASGLDCSNSSLNYVEIYFIPVGVVTLIIIAFPLPENLPHRMDLQLVFADRHDRINNAATPSAITPLRSRPRARREQSALGSVVKDGFAREKHLQDALPGNRRRSLVPPESNVPESKCREKRCELYRGRCE